MSFTGIEFTDDSGGGIALVSSQWLTPRKQEVFWPPYKFQFQYDKAIKKGVVPEQDGSWKIYKIKRCFFETDDYSKAQSKIKQAQVTFDCQSEIDDVLPSKRIIHKPRRLAYSSSDDEDEALSGKHFLPPSKIVRLNDKANETLSPSLSPQFRLEDLPVNLPVSTQADLNILETYLKSNQNLSTMPHWVEEILHPKLTEF
ncbi:hypothetical protein RF55_8283 [Lasius niger]|uniref:Uncharacterized protein n=1 Tax=Lasius niger TaxID=67767 RepID=A0A0J7KN46_LASNI|nr:hypothetical protein RF55_8283 [Lasius niger]